MQSANTKLKKIDYDCSKSMVLTKSQRNVEAPFFEDFRDIFIYKHNRLTASKGILFLNEEGIYLLCFDKKECE